MFKTITFTDVICVLILSLKLLPESNTKASNFTSLRMVLPKIAKWRRISVRARKVGFVAFQKTKCVCRFYIQLKLQCNSLTTDLQDYHFHRCYTCANIDFKATTEKQHKGEQFHESSNSSANNGKMAMYLIASLKSWLGGLSRKRIMPEDFTFNRSYSAIV